MLIRSATASVSRRMRPLSNEPEPSVRVQAETMFCRAVNLGTRSVLVDEAQAELVRMVDVSDLHATAL